VSAIHAFVSGQVQGVFFRDTARRRAGQMGLQGWVRNLPDGRVELFAQGEDEAVRRLERWLHEGPRGAEVEGVEVRPAAEDPSLAGFEMRP
jgi:acylphosphatase